MLFALAAVLLGLGEPESSAVEILSDITKADAYRYAAKDNHGVGLDCLKVEQIGKSKYIGVHHALLKGTFKLRLVESSDLLNWKHIATLDDHAHQGTIRKCGSRWILAWEKDGPDGNWIHVAGYDSLQKLKANKPAKTYDVKRTLSPAAEGTPNIDAIHESATWEQTNISIGFHYYRNRDVDRQSYGILTGFHDWSSNVQSDWNKQLEPTYHGNIGDRDTFVFGSVKHTILEAQLRKNDWSSWRILLLRGGEDWTELKIKSHGGSTSFANPSVTMLTLPSGKPGIFASYFLPSQGAAKGESGEVVFFKALP